MGTGLLDNAQQRVAFGIGGGTKTQVKYILYFKNKKGQLTVAGPLSNENEKLFFKKTFYLGAFFFLIFLPSFPINCSPCPIFEDEP